MPVLALDLATQMGWALSTPPHRAAPTLLELSGGTKSPKRMSGSVALGPSGSSPGQRFARLRQWLNDMRMVHKPRRIVFEAALPHQKSANAARIALGMVAITEGFACEFGLPCYEVHVSAVKLHATGSGNADKSQMIAKAQACGWNPVDDNEADALWLLDYFIQTKILKGRAA